MPTRLTNLRLDEVSLVDRGANQHAQIVLIKRDGEIDLVSYARKRLADGGGFPDDLTQNYFADEIAKRGAEIRKAGETPEQARVRFMMETDDGRTLFAAHKAAKPAPMKRPETRIAQTSGYLALSEQAVHLRKLDPRLSKQQAFAKVYCDPANRDLVTRHKAEHRRMSGR